MIGAYLKFYENLRDRVQHDDHIWLTVGGSAWAIHSIHRHTFVLWRGYEPDVEFSVLDVSMVDWQVYCDRAVKMLWKTEFGGARMAG